MGFARVAAGSSAWPQYGADPEGLLITPLFPFPWRHRRFPAEGGW